MSSDIFKWCWVYKACLVWYFKDCSCILYNLAVGFWVPNILDRIWFVFDFDFVNEFVWIRESSLSTYYLILFIILIISNLSDNRRQQNVAFVAICMYDAFHGFIIIFSLCIMYGIKLFPTILYHVYHNF